MFAFGSPRGFTLLETLVATGILVTALAGVAHLFILSTHLTRQANVAGAALIAAQEKLEALVALPFDYDVNGDAITDAALEPSPPSTLDEDVEPYVDHTEDETFVRRWRVSSISNAVPDSIAIEVCAFRAPADALTAQAADACLSTVRTRQP
jgi:prepilin-type N-terminal cleavage/methylation domain-containing protein